MATIAFKYHNYKEVEDFYFLYNTYYEALETIPMDLSTFLMFNYYNGTLNELLFNWEKLKKYGSTITASTFNTFFTEKEKKRIFKIEKEAGSIKISIKNKLSNEYLIRLFEKTEINSQNIFEKLNGIRFQINQNLKPINYYYCDHFIIDYWYKLENKLFKNLTEINLIKRYRKSNFPLHLVPHKFRRYGFFKNECLKKNQGYLIPEYENEIKDIGEQRVNYSKIKIIKIALTKELLVAYTKQLQNENFGISKELNNYINSNSINIEKLTLDELKKVYTKTYNYNFLPDFFYCFKKDLKFFNSIKNKKLVNQIKLYSNIHRVSYDNGGLIAMECFNNQIYKLCDANGNEHTNFCHDLEIGPEGLIVFRSSTNNNNDWEIKKYYKTYGLKNFEQNLTDDIEYENHFFNGCAEFYGQDLLSIENNKLFYFEKNKKRQNDLSHLNILRFLNSDSYNKENFWYCAPWLIKLYNNDEYLAFCAIKKDYRIYNLLNNKQKSNPKIKNQFLKHTSFEYALVIIEFKKIKRILWQNKSICYNWLNDSHIVYMLMNDNFKNEKKFILLLAKKHPDYFYLIQKNKYLDENLIKDCLLNNGSILKTLPYSLKNNFEIVLQAVMQDYTSLEYASYRLKNSKEAILKFIKINPKTIHFASNKIKKMKFFLNFKNLNTIKINDNQFKNNLNLPF